MVTGVLVSFSGSANGNIQRQRHRLTLVTLAKIRSFPEAGSSVLSGENGNNRTAGGETESGQIVSQSFWRIWRNDSTLSLCRHLSVGSGDYRPSRAGPFSLLFPTKTK